MQQPVQELQCTDHKPACTRTIGGKHAAALQKHFYPEICRQDFSQHQSDDPSPYSVHSQAFVGCLEPS
ncbi:hypothetical protein WJX74_004284 [Apatococcus lobatus]|uniref:Uncharacterized protein n=1 Tax=Apatococcus lobatus TaxID=904363 RepID=A0AAW1S6F5_9CHLO